MNFTLEKEDWDELSELVTDTIGIEPSQLFLEQMVSSNETLAQEASDWGFSDIEVRKKACETLSQFLLERSYMDEDEYECEDCDEFKEELNFAYRSWQEENE